MRQFLVVRVHTRERVVMGGLGGCTSAQLPEVIVNTTADLVPATSAVPGQPPRQRFPVPWQFGQKPFPSAAIPLP